MQVVPGDSGESGDSGDSGNSGESGDSGESGKSGNSGECGDFGECGNFGDSGVLVILVNLDWQRESIKSFIKVAYTTERKECKNLISSFPQVWCQSHQHLRMNLQKRTN